jgi:hypothetical protein
MAMIKKLLFTLSLCMMVGGALFAQSTIKGVVNDPSGNGIPFLQILLKQEGRVINGAYTDEMGAYQIFGIPAGTYDITAGGTMNCLTQHTEKGIYVSSSEVKFVNLVVNCASTELTEVEVIYVPPVFSPDQTTSSGKLTGDEVRKTPGRSITAALASLDGVASVDGSMTSVRGSRSDGQQIIIDGVRVRGTTGVVMQSVEGAELIMGGIPAEFGDGTSFTVITTRGVSRDYHGGVGVRASLEGYGQMLAEASISGPLLKGKTPQDPARMGFMISVEGNYDVDDRPLRGGTWVARPDVIKDIIANPIDYRPEGGNYIVYQRANELGASDFEKSRVRKDAQSWGFIAQAKIDVMGGGKDARGRAKNNLRFSLGGSYQYINQLDWNSGRYWNSAALFNSKHNGVITSNTLRLNARLNHRVKTDTAANAILKNIMYDINVNYTLTNQKWHDRNHKDDLFAYGYIGKFTTERGNIYDIAPTLTWTNPNDTTQTLYLENVPFLDVFDAPMWTRFDKDGYLNNGSYYNPDLVPYTQNFIDWIKEKTGVDINDLSEESVLNRNRVLQLVAPYSFTMPTYGLYFALLNGDEPERVANGLYHAPGTLNTGYGKYREEAIGARASLSLNIKDHEVKFGFEFEKLTRRNYQMYEPRRLWTLMRQYTTDSQFQLDLTNGSWLHGGDMPVIDFFGEVADTLIYPVLPNPHNFDKNLRALKKITAQDVYLDIDSYDPNDFSLDLFSNYELFNQGNSLITYNGFDYTGKISNKKINLDNFYSGGNLHEKDKYAIGAFEPIYMAFYLQDKFSISNLLFNVGVRVDYYNSNQPVLKDPFLLREAHTVGDLRGNAEWNRYLLNHLPDNVGNDWIPYVSDANNDIHSAPLNIVAYRDGKTWYNNLGQEIADPMSYLGGSGGPILTKLRIEGDPSQASSGAFTKYKPQWSVMPRISFSFPVSTNSVFYAHYNIITTRPTNWQINPIAYLFIDKYNTTDRIISNPNLRPQKTVDYEIGFRQKVGEFAAIQIGAYYREQRDLIQSYRFTGAYPNTYYSYENQDFGTVQGFTFGMHMRGTKNLNFRAYYTLSFAKGTGSSAGSNLAIIASGQPNLRTLTNLSFDQRHNISAIVDLRFDQGTNYNGPVTRRQKKGTETTREIRWLENAGATLMVSAASGMPYSRSNTIISEYGWGGVRQLKGTINGANMPWIFTCNLRIDKSFALNLASKKDKTDTGKRRNKPGMLTFYLDFQNLLNLKNVIRVYDYTGSATDDGFLSSPLFQTQMRTLTYPVASAVNYYEMMVANPYNFTQPFRVYLGIQFFF